MSFFLGNYGRGFEFSIIDYLFLRC